MLPQLTGQSETVRLLVPTPPGEVFLKPGIPHSTAGSELTPVYPKCMFLAPARLEQVTASCAPSHQQQPRSSWCTGPGGWERQELSPGSLWGPGTPCWELPSLVCRSAGWTGGEISAGMARDLSTTTLQLTEVLRFWKAFKYGGPSHLMGVLDSPRLHASKLWIWTLAWVHHNPN